MSIVIGIDPGKKTGFAAYDIEGGGLISLSTCDFWTAYAWVLDYKEHLTGVVIEAPKNKHVFHHSANVKAAHRTGVNVGSVLREAELLADGLEKWGIKVKRVEPVGKKNAEQFKKRFPTWTKRTNQHERDAAFMTLRWTPND